MEQEFEENLTPGGTKRLVVNLQSDTYEVYCPVENHKALGMDVKLTVGE